MPQKSFDDRASRAQFLSGLTSVMPVICAAIYKYLDANRENSIVNW